jgi:benzaldehyde dehydrogenase (NAD)
MPFIETSRPARSIFSPITTFASDHEAVALAKQAEYLLSAAVHSQSLPRARAVARRLRTGIVHINAQTVNDDVRVRTSTCGC